MKLRLLDPEYSEPIRPLLVRLSERSFGARTPSLTQPGNPLSLSRVAPQAADPLRIETAASIAALAFLEGVSRLGSIASLRAWFSGDVEPYGWAPGWTSVREAGHDPIPLSGDPDRRALSNLLRVSHDRVVDSLRALVWTPANDAWLSGVVHQGLLRFDGHRNPPRWIISVPKERTLSELVLALFAADLLARPEIRKDRLCVCTVCGRVTFEPRWSGRLGCALHPVNPG